ncbi:MAG: prepilin-type N-terminal cleavage/methylation domain-containing protein [Gammaproteobacteria bacterium]|nr:prepilin-type N-terminal cleavage/methylation domain-containing protein [Gammaproteobacteria bacterium]
MQKSQKGFTLVELVVVIVLLGILGVTALGKYQDLSLQAQNAANQGVASELSASSGINLAAVTLASGTGTAYNTATETCAAAAADLLAAGAPAGYTFTGGGDCTAVASFACAITSGTTGETQGDATVLCTP